MRVMPFIVVVLAAVCLGAAPASTQSDNSWRQAAEDRIEKIRKADLTVTVVDAAGKPIAGADVEVKMLRHAFGFGTCVNATLINDRDDFAKNYREQIVRLFNEVVTENDLKWPAWEGESPGFTRAKSLAGLRWLKERGITIRGHNLIWPSWQWTPKTLPQLKNDPAALQKRVLDHIEEICTRTRDICDDWDVVNEPFSHHDVIDIVGREKMVEWFKTARKYARPNCKLYINDFDIIESDGDVHRNSYAETIQFLIDHGAPLDGIGMQCHFKKYLTPPQEMLAILDRFAKFGKQLKVTEFDVDPHDEKLQAEFTRDFYTVAFSHPAVKSILMWGFVEGHHWRPGAAIERPDWTLKPNGEAYRELVFEKWWTNAKGKTDANGVFKTRGFLGDYEVVASEVRSKTTLSGDTSVRVEIGKK